MATIKHKQVKELPSSALINEVESLYSVLGLSNINPTDKANKAKSITQHNNKGAK